MEQMWPARKRMKQTDFQAQRFMKVLSSSQNPGLASAVYLRFQSIFPSNLHSCKFWISDKLYVWRISAQYAIKYIRRYIYFIGRASRNSSKHSFVQLRRMLETMEPQKLGSLLLCDRDNSAGHCLPLPVKCSLELDYFMLQGNLLHS